MTFKTVATIILNRTVLQGNPPTLVTDILHLGCQPAIPPASDLNRWLIAKVLSRGLLKDFSPFQWNARY
ncbi:hypothetical protein [Aetokthonos hydrillicola]|uniref:hypothetical protein n=1 Tax=Aetokthonos hydrillicola TaxID=1550245 RepID=UPI001ABA38E1|nr:hypothetical protein [Aetokthonos hydrillicola CCALA 1050]